MPQPESAVLEAIDAAGDGLRATFFWRVDRYAHRLERLEGGAATQLLESIEGSDLDRWPPSPPLQQLMLEQLPDRRPVALLVGMAGANHWSLSVEAEPGDAALVFDVACRIKDEGARLGSSYRSAVRHEPAENAALLYRPGGHGRPARIELLELSQDTPSAATLSTDGRGVHLHLAAAPPPTTLRWKYRVRIA